MELLDNSKIVPVVAAHSMGINVYSNKSWAAKMTTETDDFEFTVDADYGQT